MVRVHGFTINESIVICIRNQNNLYKALLLFDKQYGINILVNKKEV